MKTELPDNTFDFKLLVFLLVLSPVLLIFLSRHQKSALDEMQEKTSLVQIKLDQGMLLYNQRKFKEAIAVFAEGLTINSENYVLYNNICAAYNELQDWERAKINCDLALLINPDFELAKNNLRVAETKLLSAKQ